jgi:tetraacyldisaccharide-1-P 4'-kinase
LSALAAADVAVVIGSDGFEHEVRRFGVPEVFRMSRRSGEPRLEHPWGAECGLAPTVLAFAGIAHAEAFFDELERAGWRVASRVRFADHHRYTPRDLSRLAFDAEHHGAALLITTEKDAIRLEELPPPSRPIAWVPLTVSVEPAVAFHDRLCRAA